MTKGRKVSAQERKMNETALAFNQKLAELQEWGFNNDIIISAYLKADHEGIFPYISWVPMSDAQKKIRDDYNAKMLAESLKEEKAEKKSQDAK